MADPGFRQPDRQQGVVTGPDAAEEKEVRDKNRDAG